MFAIFCGSIYEKGGMMNESQFTVGLAAVMSLSFLSVFFLIGWEKEGFHNFMTGALLAMGMMDLIAIAFFTTWVGLSKMFGEPINISFNISED